MFRQQIRLSLFAVLAAFTLALTGCGGGGGGGDDPPMMPEPTAQEMCEGEGGRWNADETCTTAEELAAEELMQRQQAQRTAISTAIGTATTAVNNVDNDSTDSEVNAADTAIANARTAIANAADLPQAEKDANTGTVNALYTQLSGAKMARQAAIDDADDAMKAAMAKTGKDLHAALGPPVAPGVNALDNAAETLSATGLAIDVADGAGAIADGTDPASVTLMAGDSAGSLGGWAGTDYAHSTGIGASMVTHEARVYTNRGMGSSRAFGVAHTVATATGGDDIMGYYTVDETNDLTNIMAPAFMHSGTQTHQIPDRSDALYVRGTFQGAPGEYRCTGTCSSTNDGRGSPSALTGTWHFKPDAGAMVSDSDANYLYYGWWVRKHGANGMPMAASAFVGEIGDVDGTGDTPSGADLTGSATYVGNAVGKFAMSNVLDGTGNGGHFTADATLTANFGAIAADNNNGVTGTIDNFRLNDGSEDPGWSVKLNRSSAWAADGAITGPTDDATVWSIGGNAAPASGAWSGTMYDERPGDPPTGDGSTVPTTVTGTFYSEFSTIGRMVGAFGANKQ